MKDALSSSNNLLMTYPQLQQPSIAEATQSHLGSIVGDVSSSQEVFGVPEPINFHPIQPNFGNNMLMDDNALDMAHVIPRNGAMPMNPTPIASSDYFSFPASQISGLDTDASALDMPFKSNAESSAGPRFASDFDAGNSVLLDHNVWNSSLYDLTDMFNFGGEDDTSCVSYLKC
ncbi:PREDICTED: uncharacterized protein LOC109344615 [Lupinus angustifolius]|uniref:uncharacterized protein LOC109344615 n=1 Tax=Lupinus angustifolius TaxID=3871 RepID=UPI00092FBF34|nr:PREDICTED: uncharacterized protein LOC109344615 [Lupinus angustifolius]